MPAQPQANAKTSLEIDRDSYNPADTRFRRLAGANLRSLDKARAGDVLVGCRRRAPNSV
jgi:hypothetical protein